jgi:hypothetical protein
MSYIDAHDLSRPAGPGRRRYAHGHGSARLGSRRSIWCRNRHDRQRGVVPALYPTTGTPPRRHAVAGDLADALRTDGVGFVPKVPTDATRRRSESFAAPLVKGLHGDAEICCYINWRP